MRTFLSMIILAGGLIGPLVPAQGAEPEAKPPEAKLVHSASKATTFKLATIATNMAIFSLGTGSIFGGGLLTAFNVSKSWLLFTANDYAWDTYFPTQSNTDSTQAFSVQQSFWRTTGKFLTYKPVDTVIKFASIYLYTASVPTMVVYGTASSVVNSGVFYANDFAWNLYDWWHSPAHAIDPSDAGKARQLLGQR